MSKFKERLRSIASSYDTPQDFKAKDHAHWAMMNGRGWVREFFPDYIKPEIELPKQEHSQLIETPSEANLRHAVDDYIVNLRIIQKGKDSRVPKIFISRVLKDLEEILKTH